MVNFDRMFKVVELDQEKIEGEVQVDEQWPQSGKITFDNVSLRYRPSTPIVLKKLSFDVNRGEKIGIVGRTGAGKSTMCMSLSRIMELVEGEI